MSDRCLQRAEGVKDLGAVTDKSTGKNAHNLFKTDSKIHYNELGYPKPTIINLDEDIHPRKWLYHRLYLRGYVTGTAATGGTGKTSIVDVETVSMAIGCDLFNSGEPLRVGKLKILVLSLEDDETEYLRRMKAITKQYNLSDSDREMMQENIIPIFDSDGRIKIATKPDREPVKNDAAIDYINVLIEQYGADVVTIDPLISIHGVDENSNPDMQLLLSILRGLARQHDVSIHFLHHNRKGAGDSADAMRGAVALRDGARALRMLSKMTDAEADELAIPKGKAGIYIGEFSGKANLSPPADGKRWYQMKSVHLFNHTELYEGDSVGVATPFEPPKLFDGITQSQQEEALRAIGEADETARRENAQAKEWIGHIVARKLNLDVDADKTSIKRMIKSWCNDGRLSVYKIKDAKGKESPYVRLVDVEPSDQVACVEQSFNSKTPHTPTLFF